MPRSSRPPTIAYVVLAVVVVYALALGGFWALHYDGPRPTAGRVVSDFHAALGLGPDEAVAAPPPLVKPEPAPPAAIVRAKPKAPPPMPSPNVKRALVSDVSFTLRDVKKQARALRSMDRGPAFESARIDAISALTTVRDRLGAYLDEHPGDDRANGLWDDLQQLLAALRKI